MFIEVYTVLESKIHFVCMRPSVVNTSINNRKLKSFALGVTCDGVKLRVPNHKCCTSIEHMTVSRALKSEIATKLTNVLFLTSDNAISGIIYSLL